MCAMAQRGASSGLVAVLGAHFAVLALSRLSISPIQRVRANESPGSGTSRCRLRTRDGGQGKEQAGACEKLRHEA